MSKKAMKLALDFAIMHHTDAGYTEVRYAVQSALREALTEQPAPVQQGWKLVPYDPSTDMQEQGSAASGYDLSQTRAKNVYQAMIDMHEVMLEQEPTDEWLRLQAGYTEQPATVQQEPVPEAMKIVIEAMRADPDYAWSWHCNIAMAFVDAGGDHYTGNQGAARFMKMLANVAPAHELPSPLAQRNQLSVDEIFEAIRPLYSSDKAAWLAVNHSKDEYRAIEAAHGIGVEK